MKSLSKCLISESGVDYPQQVSLVLDLHSITCRNHPIVFRGCFIKFCNVQVNTFKTIYIC